MSPILQGAIVISVLSCGPSSIFALGKPEDVWEDAVEVSLHNLPLGGQIWP